jgi:hypothetical protein
MTSQKKKNWAAVFAPFLDSAVTAPATVNVILHVSTEPSMRRECHTKSVSLPLLQEVKINDSDCTNTADPWRLSLSKHL